VVYLVVGKMTGRLAQCGPGSRLVIWGPLGNGFSSEPVEHLVMVAGGIGQTPFLALGRQFSGKRTYGESRQCLASAARVTLCYGVRSSEYLAGVSEFQQAGVDVRISSEDGSVGRHGLVTGVLEEILGDLPGQQSTPPSSPSCRIVCCGPEPMLKGVARIASRYQVPCQVSLETPMACGIGICFSCVVRVKQPDGTWDYQRTCVDGPVFDAQKIVWG
jgi:dihydroorotate dehydrogenase electron transfer subunit